MILTVTLNSALDWVTFIDAFEPTTVIRASKVVESVAGKGFDTSVALRSLGIPSLALGIVAGENGKRLVELLEKYDIDVDLLWVEGETRIANVIVETRYHRHTHIMTWGYSVTPSQTKDFTNLFSERIGEASWAVFAGSLPDGLPANYYKDLIEIAHQAGVSTLIDCRGEPMQQALKVKPTIIKMNRAEYYQTFGGEFDDLKKLSRDAQQVRQREELNSMVITCGDEGILAITPQGVFAALAPSQQAVNAAGAGDSVSAALTWRLDLGDSWQGALRWAAAASAATVLSEATAESRMEDVQRIYSQTVVKPV